MRIILEQEEPGEPGSLLRLSVDALTIGERLTPLQAKVALDWVLEVRQLQGKALARDERGAEACARAQGRQTSAALPFVF